MQPPFTAIKCRFMATIALALGLPFTSVAGVIPLGPSSGNFLHVFGSKIPAQLAAVTCGFSNVQNLAFGSYDPFSTTATSTSATFTVACSNNDTVTVIFSTGNSGTYSNRYMTSTTSDQLNYNIYGDVAHTQIIGNGTGGTYYYQGTVGTGGGTGTFYGLSPAGQNVSSGNYNDAIIITMTF
jgi:spore coat protein U domain-containing protein, fimbrial subunit CupE1/2/3/6